mmetsp:Transcript_88988/g.174139  ORF Transcript_88988/g.174139 Transcript_88988/m.174139 type:complete len:94 (-) Transcript_88988:57-338(-)
MSSRCPYNTAKLGEILGNKGVCFGCFDIRGRSGYEPHHFKECPLESRLKRLVVADFDRSGLPSFEEYLRKLYASDMSFLTMLTQFSKDVVLGR